MLRAAWSILLGTILIVFGVLQWLRPFTRTPVNPALLVLAGVLLYLRYFSVRMHEKRQEMLRNVPKHPLGISEDEDD